jgi:hypothetical protein
VTAHNPGTSLLGPAPYNATQEAQPGPALDRPRRARARGVRQQRPRIDRSRRLRQAMTIARVALAGALCWIVAACGSSGPTPGGDRHRGATELLPRPGSVRKVRPRTRAHGLPGSGLGPQRPRQHRLRDRAPVRHRLQLARVPVGAARVRAPRDRRTAQAGARPAADGRAGPPGRVHARPRGPELPRPVPPERPHRDRECLRFAPISGV